MGICLFSLDLKASQKEEGVKIEDGIGRIE